MRKIGLYKKVLSTIVAVTCAVSLSACGVVTSGGSNEPAAVEEDDCCTLHTAAVFARLLFQ